MLRQIVPFSSVVAFFATAGPRIVERLQTNSDSVISNSLLVAISAAVSVTLFQYLYQASTLQFNGPIPLPILGNILSLIEKGTLQDSVQALSSTYGKVSDYLLIHGRRVVLVNDASACRTACKSTDRGDLSGKTLEECSWRERFIWVYMWGYKGLDLFTRSDKHMNWTAHRKFLLPAFDQKHVRAMAEQIETAVENLVKELPENEKIDLLPFLEDFGIDMIHQTALGLPIKSVGDGGRFLVDAFNRMMAMYPSYDSNPFLYLTVNVLPYLGLNPKEFQRRKDIETIRGHIRTLLENEASQKADEKEKDNLLSQILKGVNDEFQMENVVDELSSFIFAGYDTTSATLGNLMYELGKSPVTQQKLQDELDAAFQAGNVGLAEVAKDLPYLAACLRESQRIQPVAPMLQRRCHVDLSVKEDNGSTTTVPAGSVVIIPSYLLHRDPTQYPEPELFKPERWLDKDKKLIAPKPGYFFAFGSGPKMCIGMQLADRELKMAAAAIMSKFKVVTRGERKIVDTFTTKPEKVLVELNRRDGM